MTAAEYFVGSTDPGVGVATTMTVGGTGPTYSLSASGLTAIVGDVVSIRAKDSFNQWGPITTVVVTT